jgi:hypothetical protein
VKRGENAAELARKIALAAVVAALVGLQAAAAQGVGEGRFLASLGGTVTKRWSYTTEQIVNGCTVTTTGIGTRTIFLRSADDSVIAARRTAAGRARFTGSVRFVTETVRQSGTKTVATTGPSPCEKSLRRSVCRRLTRVLANRAAQPVSRRQHQITFRPVSGLVPRTFYVPNCPGEPSEVRSVAGGLELASAKFREADLFDPHVGGMTVQASSDVTTNTLSGSARVVQHVAWRLRLQRLG